MRLDPSENPSLPPPAAPSYARTADELGEHFGRSTDSLATDPPAAAREMRVAAARLALAAARADDAVRAQLLDCAAELELLADRVEKGAIGRARDLAPAFVRARLGLTRAALVRLVAVWNGRVGVPPEQAEASVSAWLTQLQRAAFALSAQAPEETHTLLSQLQALGDQLAPESESQTADLGPWLAAIASTLDGMDRRL